MTRRRAAAALVALALLALAGATVLLGRADDPSGPQRVGAAEVAYAGTWEATCRALDLDARTTVARLRRRVGARDVPRSVRARLARRVVSPYLGRSDRRLRRLAAVVPPPRWRAYHVGAAARLRAAADRARDGRDAARRGDLGGLSAVVGAATPGPAVPPELRRRTPACSTTGDV